MEGPRGRSFILLGAKVSLVLLVFMISSLALGVLFFQTGDYVFLALELPLFLLVIKVLSTFV